MLERSARQPEPVADRSRIASTLVRRCPVGTRAVVGVALDGTTLVFVEVKAGREGARIGPERPAHAVGRRKQFKLRRLAREWIAERRGPSGVSGYRFDVVGVSFGPDGLADVDHIRAAF